MKDVVLEYAGAWLGLAIMLTFVIPPVGLFLLGVLFAFVYPLLVLLVIASWVISGVVGIFRLIPVRV